MPPHPRQQDLTDFALGRLDASRRQSIERHVAECSACCETLDAATDDGFVDLLRAAATSFGAADDETGDDQATIDSHVATNHRDEPVIPDCLHDHARYRVVEPIGSGGMGAVFRAEHRLMQRTVALKVIRQRFTSDALAVTRFQHEVRNAAQLSHPNIVTAYDAEKAGDTHFLVMEYIDGVTFDRLIERDGALPIAHAVDFVVQAARGLAYAHDRGMIHRDVKPHNLIVTQEADAARETAAVVKILDFGIARLAAESSISESDESAALTGGESLVGTPDYLAPEQAADPRSADARSDIYGLGCTLYFLLTGQPVYDGRTALAKIVAHREHPVPSARSRRSDVPERLDEILQRMLAKRPEDRYESAGDLIAELESLDLSIPDDVADHKKSPLPQEEVVQLLSSVVTTVWGRLHSPLGRVGRAAAGEGPALPEPSARPSQREGEIPAAQRHKSGTTSERGEGAKSRVVRFAVPVLAMAALLAAAAPGLLKFDTPTGSVVVEFPDGGTVDVLVEQSRVITIRDPGDRRVIRVEIDAENQTLRLQKDGFLASTTHFDLTTPSGQRVRAKFVRPEPERNIGADNEPDPQRAVAQWAQKFNAVLMLAVGGSTINLGPESDLPPDDFRIVNIQFAPFSGPSDDDLEFLSRYRAELNLGTLGLRTKLIKGTGLAHLAGLRMETLLLDGNKIAADDFEHLGRLGNLKTLGLGYTTIDDDSLTSILPLRNLRSISLLKTRITNRGIRLLTQFEKLEIIDLGRTAVTGDALVELAQLRQLHSLYLSEVKVADTDIATLTRMPQLQSLSLDFTDVSDDAVQYLATLKQLTFVGLNHTRVTDDGVIALSAALPRLQKILLPPAATNRAIEAVLTDHPKLERLLLPAERHIDDRTLEIVGRLGNHLQQLEFQNTSITEDGLSRLQSRHPNLTIGGVAAPQEKPPP